MLESNLRSILCGLVTVFLLQNGVWAATVDASAPQDRVLPLASFESLAQGAVPADIREAGVLSAQPFLDGKGLDIFASTDLPRPDLPTASAVSRDGRSEPPAVAAETGFIHALFVDTKRMASRWPGLTALGTDNAGWQILLPSLPDAPLRNLFGRKMSPTALMFASGLVGLVFLARCRPRRRGQLGLMT